MPEISANSCLLPNAVEAFLQGRPGEAELLCEGLLQTSSAPPIAAFLKGMILAESGDLESAVPSLEQALALEPDNFAFHLYTSDISQRLQNTEKAIAHLKRAFRLCPQNVSMLVDLAESLKQAGLLQEAKICYQRLLLALPGHPGIYCDLAEVLNHLGETEHAVHAYEQALRAVPDSASARNNAGNLLFRLDRLEEAERHYRQGLLADSSHSEINFNLARLCSESDRLGEALEFYRMAVTGNPGFAEAWDGLGSTLSDCGQHEEALECFGRALELKTGWPQATWNRALTLLKTERFAKGWEDYEARLQIPEICPPRALEGRTWAGGQFRGQSLLVIAEQGLGDAIQFLRYLPLAKQLGGHVIVECRPELSRLVATCEGIDQVITRGQALPPYDCYVRLMSLPHLFQTEFDNVPNTVPYLNLLAKNRLKMAGKPLKVGLAWAGSPQHRLDRRRSCRLADLADLLQIPGIYWFSLQRNILPRDQEVVSQFPALTPEPASSRDLYDTAQWISQLDLVISVDTAVAHLAGALGLPVWIMLSTVADWRWLTCRADSPWYPTAKLFRQNRLGDWKELAQRVKSALQDLL